MLLLFCPHAIFQLCANLFHFCGSRRDVMFVVIVRFGENRFSFISCDLLLRFNMSSSALPASRVPVPDTGSGLVSPFQPVPQDLSFGTIPTPGYRGSSHPVLYTTTRDGFQHGSGAKVSGKYRRCR